MLPVGLQVVSDSGGCAQGQVLHARPQWRGCCALVRARRRRVWLTRPLGAQIFYAGDVATSSIKYNSDELADSGTSLFHELGELETRGRWCRVWCAPRLQGSPMEESQARQRAGRMRRQGPA